MPTIAAAVVAAGKALAPAALVVGAGAGVYSIAESRSQAKKASSAARKQTMLDRERFEAQERQAGEYYDLSREQMTMQARANEIKTLVNVVAEKGQPAPTVFTLPPAKTQSPVDKINTAIGQLFRAA